MNNKTVVAVLVLILVALAGVGVGKYAHNVNNKQQAASLESQSASLENEDAQAIQDDLEAMYTPDAFNISGTIAPTDASVAVDMGEPVYYTLPNGKMMLSCNVGVSLGALPPPGTLLPGIVQIHEFEVDNTNCPNDVVLNQVHLSLVQIGFPTPYNFRASQSIITDGVSNAGMTSTVGVGPTVSTMNDFWYMPGMTIPAGTVSTFKILSLIDGMPVAGNLLVTQLVNGMQITIPAQGNVPAILVPGMPLPGYAVSS